MAKVVTHSFIPGDRYRYDYDLCPKGYAQLDTAQDASYFGMWANPHTRHIVQYVEGDVYDTRLDTDEEFCEEIREIVAFHGDDFIGIDPGFNTSVHERFIALGLGTFLPEAA